MRGMSQNMAARNEMCNLEVLRRTHLIPAGALGIAHSKVCPAASAACWQTALQ